MTPFASRLLGLLHIKIFVTGIKAEQGNIVAPPSLPHPLPSTANGAPTPVPATWHSRSPQNGSALPIDERVRPTPVVQRAADKQQVSRTEFGLYPGRPDLAALLQEEIEYTDFSDWIAVSIPSSPGGGGSFEVQVGPNTHGSHYQTSGWCVRSSCHGS